MKSLVKTQRLLLFAERLNRIKHTYEPLIETGWFVTEDDEWIKTEFDMTYFYELPFVFDEWIYNEPTDDVTIKRYPNYLGMMGKICRFFRLTREEFIRLFDTRKKNLSPQDVVTNILEFINRKNKYYPFT